MVYREPPPQLAVVALGRGLVALDVASGAIAWAHQTKSNVGRLFKVGPRVMVVAGAVVTCLDHDTGQLVGELDVGFYPEAGIVSGTDLILVQGNLATNDRPCMVCLTSEGAIRWRGVSSFESRGLLSGDSVLRTFGPSGEPRSQHTFDGLMSGHAGLVLGDVTVQPDRTGS